MNMEKIEVVNIKCGGCSNHIKKELEKLNVKNINIDLEKQIVSFDGDLKIVEKKLIELGYPSVDSEEAKSILKKAKSYVSCAIGRMQN